MVKKGDTLIEVTLAIGIFSMIAIAVASVMSGGTAGAQLSLETTLAREEIDTQADALRFIHAAYTANKDNKDHPYTSLWRKITANAIDIKGYSKERLQEILQYAPQSCADLYSDSAPGINNAFVINPRDLNAVSANIGNTPGSSDLALVKKDSKKLAPASTYPHLVYGNSTNNEDNSNLADNTFPTSLYKAEGIYVIAIKDPTSTGLVDVLNDEYASASAYYDFYIRTCWYGSNDEDPSTISTVIRLHDPESIFAGGSFDVAFSGFDSASNPTIKDRNNIRRIKLPIPYKYAYTFKYWQDRNDDKIYRGNEDLINDSTSSHPKYDLEAQWEHTEYKINFDLDGGSAEDIHDLTCYQDVPGCTIPNEKPTKSGAHFKGWCSGNVVNEICSGQTYSQASNNLNFPGANMPNLFPTNRTLNLKAIWSEWNDTYRITLTWGSTPSDLDSHVKGQKSDGTYFHAYYGSKVGNNINGMTIAQLDQDVTRGYGPETFTLNTLGGKNYYYYVYCYSSCTKINGATVTVDIKNSSGGWDRVETFYSNNATGSGRYWNVFAYKDGKIYPRQTHSSTEQTDY